MKTKVYNYDKIKESEINDRVIRVKALMINSKNEILLGEAFHTIQFPGGHIEEGETLSAALKREVQEETGIILKDKYEPFLAIKYFLKDYPVLGNNRSIEIYYYEIHTDEAFHLENANLDDQERSGDFHLFYIPFKDLKKVLYQNITLNQINSVVTKEMMLASKYLKRKEKGKILHGNKKI